MLLRWLLTRAVIDQGTDIAGIREWYDEFVERCYAKGIHLIHDPLRALVRYPEILAIADEVRIRVESSRAAIWASGKKRGRSEKAYNVFHIPEGRSREAHWFVTTRVLPGYLSYLVRPGGITDLVFGGPPGESARDMARRIRNAEKNREGLGWAIGYKACDLFAKWTVDTYMLQMGTTSAMTPFGSPIPMDQRAGRVLMRVGFMEELFGVARVAARKGWGLTERDGTAARPPRTTKAGTAALPPPAGRWHLRVTAFREMAAVRPGPIERWLTSAATILGIATPTHWRPQDALQVIVHAHAIATQSSMTPAGLDDAMMEVAEGTCTDDLPTCSACFFSSHCGVTQVVSHRALVGYFT
jgi:hypothetical protein